MQVFSSRFSRAVARYSRADFSSEIVRVRAIPQILPRRLVSLCTHKRRSRRHDGGDHIAVAHHADGDVDLDGVHGHQHAMLLTAHQTARPASRASSQASHGAACARRCRRHSLVCDDCRHSAPANGAQRRRGMGLSSGGHRCSICDMCRVSR